MLAEMYGITPSEKIDALCSSSTGQHVDHAERASPAVLPPPNVFAIVVGELGIVDARQRDEEPDPVAEQQARS